MTIEFDKPRELRFDLSAIKDLEAAMNGQPLGAIVHQMSQMSVTALTTALYVGLRHDDRALTPSLITKMLGTYLKNGGEVGTLMNAVSDALAESGLFKNEQDELPNSRPEATTTA